MSRISGFLEPLLPDKSSLAPIAKPNQSSAAHFDRQARDQLVSAEEEGFYAFPASFPISEREQLSLGEFAKIIHENLSFYAQTQEAANELDQLMNQRLGTSLAATAAALRKYRSKLLAYLVSSQMLIDAANQAIFRIQRAVQKHQAEVTTAEELQEEMDAYNASAEEYRLESEALNAERSFFHLPKITPLAALSQVSLEEQNLTISPSKIQEIDLQKLMKDVYDPVFNAAIGYMSDISNLFDVPKVCRRFGRTMVPSTFVVPVDPALAALARGFVQRFGGLSRKDSAIRIGISWNTLDRILAGTAIAASMLEARIPLMPREFDEIQLTTLNLLVKSTIQSSTGLSFALLGQDLGKLAVGETQLAAVLALAYVKRLCSVVHSTLVDKNIEFLVETHPRLVNFPEGDRRLLVHRLASIVKLGLLQNGLVQLSIALQTPGLAGQMLSMALAQAGVKKTMNAQTFNDLIAERTLVVKVQAKLVRVLIAAKMDQEEAYHIVESALESSVKHAPYSTLEEWTHALSIYFLQAGIKSLKMARELSLKAAVDLISPFPRCLLVAPKLHAGLTLGLIDPKVLLTKRALQIVLEGYDLDVFKRIYYNAITELFVVADLQRLVRYMAVDPLLNNIEEHAPPMTLRQVLVDLYRALIRQGVGVNDAIQIAEQMLKYLVHSAEAQVGFKMPPNTIKIIQESFQSLFQRFGLENSEANELSQKSALAGLNFPEEIADLRVFEELCRVLHEMEGQSLDETLLSETMQQQGISGQLARKLAEAIASWMQEGNRSFSVEKGSEALVFIDAQEDSKMSPEGTKHLLEEALEGEGIADEVLSEAILNTEVLVDLMERGDIDFSQIFDKVARASKIALEKGAQASNEKAFRSVLNQVIVDELKFVDLREAALMAEGLVIHDAVRRELFVRRVLLSAKKEAASDAVIEKKLRSAVCRLYRSDVQLSDVSLVKETLAKILQESEEIPQPVIQSLMNGLKIGVPLLGQSSIWSHDFSSTLSQNTLREQLNTCMMEHFRKAISLEKAKMLSEELIVTLMGSASEASAQAEGHALMQLVIEQIDELVMRAGSKQYKKIILDGVVDTMSNCARINFDMFLFTELLNINGKNFLKLIQEVLLNNLGVKDRSIEKTIDLLI